MSFISETLQASAAKFEPVRLPFTLPGFTRTSWVSDHARDVWESRLKRAARAWQRIESESVREGLRPARLLAVHPKNLDRYQLEIRKSGLEMRIIDQIYRQDGYIRAATVPKHDDPRLLCVAVGRSAAIEHIGRASTHNDHLAINATLGCPTCCSFFFQQQRIENNYCDTTWAMAVASHAHVSDDFRILHCEGAPETNLLWRGLGIRAVPHLPCHFGCAETIALARTYFDLGRRLGLGEALDDITTILSWPIEWSSLHGIAEIKTPIMKISTATDAFAYKHTVRRGGEVFPAEAPVGLNFPYNRPKKNKLSASPAFRRGLAHDS